MAKKILVGLIIIAALTAAFFVGGDAPANIPHPDAQSLATSQLQSSDEPSSEATEKPSSEPSKAPTPSASYSNSTTTPVPATPSPIESQDAEVSQEKLICTISINCAAILPNIDLLTDGKAELVPEDGYILGAVETEFYESESVFNVLSRVVKQYAIHMEYMNTPLYNAAYIEGIANLYEFDCGPLSGWMYKVNGLFPNYGCSRYQVQSGDVIEFLYTCDLGNDIGGGISSGGQFNKD